MWPNGNCLILRRWRVDFAARVSKWHWIGALAVQNDNFLPERSLHVAYSAAAQWFALWRPNCFCPVRECCRQFESEYSCGDGIVDGFKDR